MQGDIGLFKHACFLSGSMMTVTICSLRMYNSLVERCFTDCVDSFRRKDLDSTEEKVLSKASIHVLIIIALQIKQEQR